MIHFLTQAEKSLSIDLEETTRYILDSCRADKFSFHVYYNVLCKDTALLKVHLKSLRLYYIKDRPISIFNDDKLLDLSLYASAHALRLPG